MVTPQVQRGVDAPLGAVLAGAFEDVGIASEPHFSQRRGLRAVAPALAAVSGFGQGAGVEAARIRPPAPRIRLPGQAEDVFTGSPEHSGKGQDRR